MFTRLCRRLAGALARPAPPACTCRATKCPKECAQFIARKRACSRDNYVSDTLRPHDALGCCAAGILFIHRDHACVIVLREMRKERALLNLVGGKRDACDETPWRAAAREAEEELQTARGHCVLSAATLRVLRGSAPPRVGWYAEGKYAVYVVDCTDADAEAVCAARISDDACNIEFVPVTHCDDAALWHPFAAAILRVARALA